MERSQQGDECADGVTAIVVALIAVAALRGDWALSRSPAPVLGVILSLGFVVASLKQRAPHYLALAGVAIALGLLIGSRNGVSSVNWLFLGLGAASALIGSVRLVLFMKNHPRPTVEGA